MLRHVALFRFVPEMTDEQREAAVAGLRTLPAEIPEIRDYKVGLDAGLAAGNYDLAVVGDFDDAAGQRAYLDHPAHVKAAETLVRPFLADRAALQYEI